MKVIIIGGGLAGPSLALALHKHNITCKIFDLRDKSASDGGFIALAPNALRALDRIGMYERLSGQGWNYEEFQFRSSRNLSHIGSVLNGSQKKYGYKALRISRGIVRQTLMDAVHERGIELHYNSKCVDIEETNRSTVIATFADGRTEEADLLIGADGIHSRVRAHLDPKAVPAFSGQFGIGASVPRSKLSPSSQGLYMPCLILGKLNSFMLMPCTYTGDKVGCSATVESKDRSREEWAKLQNDKDALYAAFQSHHEHEAWPEVVHAASKNIDRDSLSVWPFYKVPKLSSWSSESGRIVVMGDSAHAMPPTGGQGSAMAFEDALTLADVLNSQNTESSRLPQSIKHWQSVRQARVKKILAFTSKGGDMRKHSVSTVQQALKEWVMWAYFYWEGEDGGFSWIYEYDTSKLDSR